MISDPIIEIAEAAGKIILKHYGTSEHQLKEDNSPLTAADTEAGQYIEHRLRQLTPHIPIICEESTLPPYSQRQGWKEFWLVDPLDGTKEFLKKNGEFTVNIALIRNGKPERGVIVAPAKGITFYGAQDKGSWKKMDGGEFFRIYRRKAAQGEPLTVVCSRSHLSKETEAYLSTLTVKEMVSSGSSLKFCLVAEGKADVYPRLSPVMEWDVAAGDCIFRYATHGEPNFSPLNYNSESLKVPNFILGEK